MKAHNSRERELDSERKQTEDECFLADTLTGEEKKRFLDFADAWSAFNGDSTLNGYVTGFRLGACFVMDTFLSGPPVKDEE